MGTLSYILLYYHYIRGVTTQHDTKCLRDPASPSPWPSAPSSPTSSGPRRGAALQARGRQEDLGLPQGEEAPGPREQAVLCSRQEDGARLREGQGARLRDGQVPQGPPDQPLDGGRVEVQQTHQHLNNQHQCCTHTCNSNTVQMTNFRSVY